MFHNNPPSVNRPRHRNHQVTSQIVVDQNGREHLLLNFYVKGSDATATQESHMDMIRRWKSELTSWSWDMDSNSCIQSMQEHIQNVFERSRNLFRFLSGESSPVPVAPLTRKPDIQEEKKEQSWSWGVTGLFSGLKGSVKNTGAYNDLPDGKMYEEGEVHVDLVMVRRLFKNLYTT